MPAFFISVLVVALAEIGDKTQVATIVLAAALFAALGVLALAGIGFFT